MAKAFIPLKILSCLVRVNYFASKLKIFEIFLFQTLFFGWETRVHRAKLHKEKEKLHYYYYSTTAPKREFFESCFHVDLIHQNIPLCCSRFFKPFSLLMLNFCPCLLLSKRLGVGRGPVSHYGFLRKTTSCM